jgi:aminoglycoside/choline kinase family phosphotransferase
MTHSVTSLTPQLETAERHTQREAFLKISTQNLVALPSDASKRQYFRYEQGLLMDAPPPEDVSQFMRIADYLRSLGLSAPEILNYDLIQGFLALEDFGEATYTKLLQAGEDPYSLYELAVDTLIALHQRAETCPPFVGPYNLESLLSEVALYVDWYLPTFLEKSLTENEKKDYFLLWEEVFIKALKVPHSLVLRDYHVDNLMRLNDRPGAAACGLLDFQDALWGPVVYDLVSLTEDARLDLDPALIECCWQRYLSAFPNEEGEVLRNAGCILSAGRHTKILGIFTRLSVRDGKSQYLKHIPRVKKLLQGCLQNPALGSLKNWFEGQVL